jgi:hypothetical protein
MAEQTSLAAKQTNSDVSNPINAKQFVVKRLQAMMIMLTVQFLLGMALNTIGEPDSSTAHGVSILWHTLLALHVVVAIGLFINAALILVYSVKNFHQLTKPTLISLSGIVLAIIFGSLTVSHFHTALMSFFMAAAFLLAVSIYGRTLAKLGPVD